MYCWRLKELWPKLVFWTNMYISRCTAIHEESKFLKMYLRNKFRLDVIHHQVCTVKKWQEIFKCKKCEISSFTKCAINTRRNCNKFSKNVYYEKGCSVKYLKIYNIWYIRRVLFFWRHENIIQIWSTVFCAIWWRVKIPILWTPKRILVKFTGFL